MLRNADSRTANEQNPNSSAKLLLKVYHIGGRFSTVTNSSENRKTPWQHVSADRENFGKIILQSQ